MFLSQIKYELFQLPDKCLPYSSLSKEELQAIRSPAEDISIFITKADKGSCVVVWDRLDYFSEAGKQLGDKKISKDVLFNDKILRDLVENTNNMLLNLKKKRIKYQKGKRNTLCTIMRMLAIL